MYREHSLQNSLPKLTQMLPMVSLPSGSYNHVSSPPPPFSSVPSPGPGTSYNPMTTFSSVSSLAQPVQQVQPMQYPQQIQRSASTSSEMSVSSGFTSPTNPHPLAHYRSTHTSSSSSPAESMSSPSSADSPSRDVTSYDSSSSDRESVGSAPGTSGAQAKQRKGKGVPYIPSYMDLTNGPEPCVVCSDAATGYHYRCMTCEGCKGFFRRTIQKNLQYHCKWSRNCIIDKNTRNQCQECRFLKCLLVGMAADLVLNEKQRTAKRKLIEENRERKREEQTKTKSGKDSTISDMDSLTDFDRGLICDVCAAYEYTSGSKKAQSSSSKSEYDSMGPDLQPTELDNNSKPIADAMTPSIVKVVAFAKGIPGFTELNVDDQILLLKSCCMEIMCLRAACRFDPDAETLTLHNGVKLEKSQIHQDKLAVLIEPIFDFAIGLAKLKLDKAEVALLAAVLLMQSDRSGLNEPENVEKLQDAILGAFKRYIAENRPHQPVHWAKILMKVTDLRTISTRHAERVLCIRLDNSGELPPLLFEMFNEGDEV